MTSWSSRFSAASLSSMRTSSIRTSSMRTSSSVNSSADGAYFNDGEVSLQSQASDSADCDDTQRAAAAFPVTMPALFSKHYLACMTCGAAMQMSFFLTFFNVDLFQFFFPTFDPEFWLSLSISLASVGTSVLMVWRPVLFSSYRVTLVVGYVCSALFCAVIPCILLLTSTGIISQTIGFVWLIVNKFIVGVFQAIAGGALFSFYGTHLSDWCVQSAQAGTPLGGLIIYAAHLILKASLGGSRAAFLQAGFIQFGLVVFMLLLACRISIWLTSFQRRTGLSAVDSLARDERSQPLLQGHHAADEQQRHQAADDGKTASRSFSMQDLKSVYRDIWQPCVCYVLVLCINQGMYPGVFSILHGRHNDGWFVVILFGCFGVCNSIGQLLPKWITFFSHRTCWASLALHSVCTVFVWLIMQPRPDVLAAGVFHSNYTSYAFACVWGLLCGINVCSHITIISQFHGANRQKKGQASTLALVHGRVGLLMASMIGLYLLTDVFATYQWVCPSNGDAVGPGLSMCACSTGFVPSSNQSTFPPGSNVTCRREEEGAGTVLRMFAAAGGLSIHP